MARVFVIRPFEKKKDSGGAEIDFDEVHRDLIGPALSEAELDGGTTGEIIDSGNIREDMFSLILAADFVIVDITVHNANVFYELGIRHALRRKRTLMIRGEPTADRTPFDLLGDRYLKYDLAEPKNSVSALTDAIRSSMAAERATDSPVFEMLPTLVEADPAVSRFLVPSTFEEEVERAKAIQSKGWLRLLAKEVASRPFQHSGMRVVADAQWKIDDLDGARQSWESIRQNYPDDVPANLALASIYERLSRKTKDKQLFARSDVAIRRVLDQKVDRKDRAEALALMGRNRKTEWRRRFEGEADPAKRRNLAISRTLLDSYRYYREAFFHDLNHYYSGLNTLQMATIVRDLSNDPAWKDIFDSDKEADEAKLRIDAEVAALLQMVPASLEAAKLRGEDRADEWWKITEADLRFLTTTNLQRVVRAYESAVPPGFAWGAARGQLALFETLGVRADVARAVIDAIESRSGGFAPVTAASPLQVIMFAGHRIDPERGHGKFPAQEESAAASIRRGLEQVLKPGHRYEAYASAAAGADILFHEICHELNVPSTICLPMPPEDYSREVFGPLDEWRNRFLEFPREMSRLILSDRPGLPSWLVGSTIEPWGRGNEWVLQIARSREAAHVALLAFWDGKEARGPGGTDDMVRIARDAGDVEIAIVYSP